MNGQVRGFRGNIVGVELNEVIQFMCISTNDYLKFKVISGINEGTICIAKGQIVHAQTLKKEGEDAFYEILSWPQGEFFVSPTEPEMIGKVTIHKPWQQLILESAKLRDERVFHPSTEPERIPVHCEKCDRRFLIPSDKIPSGKKARLKCPSCQNVIEVSREEEVMDGFELEIERWKREEVVVEDIFLSDKEGVLICSSDTQSIEKLSQMFSSQDYNVRVAKTGKEGFNYLKEGLFQIVILDEFLGKTERREHNALLLYVQKLPMSIRRKFFLCLLSNSLKTRDQWAAFRLGVDVIINKDSLDLTGEVIYYTLSHKKRTYEPFMDELHALRVT
ncbi:MAG: DUF4388 domain-containing protein [Syntrophobacterales bacterium]|nr:DUF4388 domain-containing protein [Syntrophobacterales bacterium]